MKLKIPTGFLLLISIISIFFVEPCICAPLPTTIRVGVYENKPLVFKDNSGAIAGLCIDFLADLAAKKGWKLEFIYGTWPQCLKRLEKGEIDIQTAIGFSRQRAKKFSFSKTALLSNWAQVYSSDKTKIDSILDLEGKSMAVLRADIYAIDFKKLADKFSLNLKIVYVENYQSVFKNIANGQVQAGVVNRLFAMKNQDRYNVYKTPVIFSPIKVVFASQKGKNTAVLDEIDKRLTKIKSDKNSQYFQWLDYWFDGAGHDKIPNWLMTVTEIGIALAVFFFVLVIILRNLVKAKTKELLSKYKELENQIAIRKKAETALIESERNYREIFDSVSDAIFIHDADDGAILDVNKKMIEMFGFSKEEALALDPDRSSLGKSPYSKKEALEYIGKALKGAPQTFEWVSRRKDDSLFSTEVSLRPAVINGRQRIIASVRDIDSRKNAEKALDEIRTLFDSFMKHMPAIAFMKEKTGRYLFINDSFSKLTGEKALPEKGLFDGDMAGENSSASLSLTDQNVIESMAVTSSYEKLTLSGEIRHFHVKKFPIFREGGPEIIGGLAFDITNEVKADLEKGKMEKQLLHAQKMEAIGTMAGGIAHDFNNMLQAITGYAQLVLMECRENDSQSIKMLKGILKTVSRAGELTKRLLIFGRKVDTKLRPVNINDEIANVNEILKRTIPKNIIIQLKLDDNIKTIMADPVQIEQVLINLGINARDAMAEGGSLIFETTNVYIDSIFSATRPELSEGDHICLAVSDTGTGMDDVTRNRIFEPFFTTKDEGKGTGLGLAMIYGIVKSHGGYITCYSEPEKGSSFKIYFPALSNEYKIQEDIYVKKDSKGGNETILLVDDEEAILEIAKKMLERHGYSTINASNGEEALSVLRSEKGRNANGPDLVILDLNMPGMDGEECLKRILSMRPSQKVIIASGYTLQEDSIQKAFPGASGIVTKPYQMANFLKLVREILDKK